MVKYRLEETIHEHLVSLSFFGTLSPIKTVTVTLSGNTCETVFLIPSNMILNWLTRARGDGCRPSSSSHLNNERLGRDGHYNRTVLSKILYSCLLTSCCDKSDDLCLVGAKEWQISMCNPFRCKLLESSFVLATTSFITVNYLHERLSQTRDNRRYEHEPELHFGCEDLIALSWSQN